MVSNQPTSYSLYSLELEMTKQFMADEMKRKLAIKKRQLYEKYEVN